MNISKLIFIFSFLISFSTLLKADEFTYQILQDHIVDTTPIKNNEFSKNEIFICRVETRIKSAPIKKTNLAQDWKYYSSVKAIKFVKTNHQTYFELNNCKNKTLQACKKRAKATIYYRPKIDLIKGQAFTLKTHSNEIIIVNISVRKMTAFDTFTADSDLEADFIEVIKFSISPAYEYLQAFGAGKVINRYEESLYFCF